MNIDLVKRYAQLKIQAAQLEDEMEMIKPEVLLSILEIRGDSDSPVQLQDFPGYSFTVKELKKWEYSPETTELANQLKERQKVEKQTGDAIVVEENHSLIFNSPKANVAQ